MAEATKRYVKQKRKTTKNVQNAVSLRKHLSALKLEPDKSFMLSMEYALVIQEERGRRAGYRAPGLTRTSVLLGTILADDRVATVMQEAGLILSELFEDVEIKDFVTPTLPSVLPDDFEIHVNVASSISTYWEVFQERGRIDALGLAWGLLEGGEGTFLKRIKRTGADPKLAAGLLRESLSDLWKKERTQASEEVEKAVEEPITAYQRYIIEKTLHNDQWAEEDLLGYELYATAVKEIIIQGGEKTRPPLSIAILAPWGQGKTTLMQYIKREFDNMRNMREEENHLPKDINAPQASIKDLMSWARTGLAIEKKIAFPTVWFNPWKYESSEQIWAGMAHSIITQLVHYLTPKDQERFWFDLNLKRIDTNALRSKIHKIIISELVSNLGWIIIISLLFLCLPFLTMLAFTKKIPELNSLMKTISAISSLFGFSISSIFSYIKTLGQKLKDKVGDIIREPNYEKRMGVFHEVDTDLQRVFDLLVDQNQPAIIFIDDLDRCSPDKVVEVIEAINLIINSDFGNKCYFIIGMDAQMVAASLDERYGSLVGKFKQEENKYGSIGWYFLDKFIQLPFILPILSPTKKLHLLSELFERKPKFKIDNQLGKTFILEEEDQKIISDYLKDKRNNEKKEKVHQLSMEKDPSAFEKQFMKQSIQEVKEDSSEIIGLLEKFAPYLGTSPRSIKRFVNMFRFYNTYQELRNIKGEAYAEPDPLAKWIVLSLRYPQLVRFIQWEREDKIINSRVPEDKAKKIDNIINRFKKTNGSKINFQLLQKWKKRVGSMGLEGFEWLKEDDLIKLLLRFDDKQSRLQRAVECNMW